MVYLGSCTEQQSWPRLLHDHASEMGAGGRALTGVGANGHEQLSFCYLALLPQRFQLGLLVVVSLAGEDRVSCNGFSIVGSNLN